MRLALNSSGNKVFPTKNIAATCPGCDEPVIACMTTLLNQDGTPRANYWRHKSDCDCFVYEEMSQWHVDWQNEFHPDWQEYWVGKHRADVMLNYGIALEIQKSAIQHADVTARQCAYGALIWVVNNEVSRRWWKQTGHYNVWVDQGDKLRLHGTDHWLGRKAFISLAKRYPKLLLDWHSLKVRQNAERAIYREKVRRARAAEMDDMLKHMAAIAEAEKEEQRLAALKERNDWNKRIVKYLRDAHTSASDMFKKFYAELVFKASPKRKLLFDKVKVIVFDTNADLAELDLANELYLRVSRNANGALVIERDLARILADGVIDKRYIKL